MREHLRSSCFPTHLLKFMRSLIARSPGGGGGGAGASCRRCPPFKKKTHGCNDRTLKQRRANRPLSPGDAGYVAMETETTHTYEAPRQGNIGDKRSEGVKRAPVRLEANSSLPPAPLQSAVLTDPQPEVDLTQYLSNNTLCCCFSCDKPPCLMR